MDALIGDDASLALQMIHALDLFVLPREHCLLVTVVALASGDCITGGISYWNFQRQTVKLTRMILESAMYAPFLVPSVPCQAVRPPPQARLAKVTFWNQLFHSFHSGLKYMHQDTLTQCQIQKDLAKESAAAICIIRTTRLTISLTVYYTVDDICICISPSVPRVLPASKGAAIERSICIAYGGNQSL
jgi:hypothetical protein